MDKRLELTHQWIERFERELTALEVDAYTTEAVDPVIAKAIKDAHECKLADLRREFALQWAGEIGSLVVAFHQMPPPIRKVLREVCQANLHQAVDELRALVNSEVGNETNGSAPGASDPGKEDRQET